MSYKEHFSRFLQSRPRRLHFAAHSHHPWPDVSFAAHQQAWLDAAEMMDDKWDHVFGQVIPDAQAGIAAILSLPDPATLTFAPNTHEFLVRIFSCLEPPIHMLSTDAEFHSFARQSRRWEEAGLAKVERVTARPFETFQERFEAAAASPGYDLVYLSQVFFDSAFVVPDLERIVETIPDDTTFCVIDGYHGFMALPTDFSNLANRAFYVAGGYKYAMAGAGTVFLHSPPGYGPRPVDTGWYAGFGDLESRGERAVVFAEDGTRFAGATFDPSAIYRLNAAMGLLAQLGLSVGDVHRYVGTLQEHFLDTVGDRDLPAVNPATLLPDRSWSERGHFLTFQVPEAATVYQGLHDREVITDYRGDRLRLGFGLYQDGGDVEELCDRLSAVVG